MKGQAPEVAVLDEAEAPAVPAKVQDRLLDPPVVFLREGAEGQGGDDGEGLGRLPDQGVEPGCADGVHRQPGKPM